MASKNPLATHEIYIGPNNREMPRLLSDGRVPISPQQLYWTRLVTLNNYLSAGRRNDSKGIAAWQGEMAKYWNLYTDTGFGVARHKDKGIIIVPNAGSIRELNPDTQLSAGDRYIVLPDGTFDSLKSKGHHYTNSEVQKYFNRQLKIGEALSSPAWKDFIPNKDIREMAIKVTYEQSKERFPEEFQRYDRLMGVFSPNTEKQEVMGLFSFRRLEDRSYADGWGHLVSGDGRLVGVNPGVAEGDVQKLEDILAKYPELRKAAGSVPNLRFASG